MAYDPDYLCGNPICADVLTEQLEARKRDADEIERLRAAYELAEEAALLLARTGDCKQEHRDRALTMLDRARTGGSVSDTGEPDGSP